MEAKEYVIRKALKSKTIEEIVKEFSVDEDYVEELANSEYQKPQHNFVRNLYETRTSQSEETNEENEDGSGSEESIEINKEIE